MELFSFAAKPNWAMDFFTQQETARRRTFILVFYLALAIVAMVATVYVALIVVYYFTLRSDDPPTAEREYNAPAEISFWNPGLMFLVGVGVPGVIAGGSFFKAMQLNGGGKDVATMLGGKRITTSTNDFREKQLLNIVEEMALASGMPTPSVYLLEGEDSINAFAAGYSTDDAVIGVNRGALRYLTRDEMQGVVAHEFSHILNGDMRFNVRLIAILAGILLMATIGFYVFRFAAYSGGSRDKKGAAGFLAIGAILVIVGYGGLFFARLIKAAISRQREYLADASAVQFTRNPDGIAGALKKIGGLASGSSIKSPEAEATSHLFFCSAMSGEWLGLWSTHPPLAKRIKAIDPSFDGKFPRTMPLAEAPSPKRKQRTEKSDSPFPRFPTPMGQAMPKMPLPIDPAIIVASLANPNESHLATAHSFIESIPESLREAMHEVYTARFVVYCLLLDDDVEIRKKQLDMIESGEPKAGGQTLKLAARVAELGVEARLPIIEIVQATLVDMSPTQYDHFSATVEKLVLADNRVSLFEFIIKRLVVEHLNRRIGDAPSTRVLYKSLTGVQRHIEVVLSLLARIGHRNEDDIEQAYQAGMKHISPSTKKALPLNECGLKQMDAAFNALFASVPAIKKRTLHAAYACIAHDGVVTVHEAELFRSIADALGVPAPPISVGAVPPPTA